MKFFFNLLWHPSHNVIPILIFFKNDIRSVFVLVLYCLCWIVLCWLFTIPSGLTQPNSELSVDNY